jgi:alanyl-tRNA synthetase
MQTSGNIRQMFLDFWQEEPRNSKVIPNASLVPLNDPTLLFVNSGMFPIVPYLAGQPHPLGTRLHNVQRCVRTIDIEEVGDNRHMVMFEMIGNWSLGDFTKEQQIPWIFEFLVERLKLDPNRIYVTVFAGDDSAPRDDVAIETWKEAFAKYDIAAEFSENISDIPATIEEGNGWKKRIFPYNKKKNWWTRAEIPGEIGGPCSEMFYDMGVKERDDESYHVNDDSGRFVEVGNNVFMEYKLDENMKWQPLEQKNIDFGGGLERLVIAAQGTTDPYNTDLFSDVTQRVSELSGKPYVSKVELNEETKAFRVIAEHARSATFILADGIFPGSKDQGYILRRLIRRMVRFGHKIGINQNFTRELAEIVINTYGSYYTQLPENRDHILTEIDKEEIKFKHTLEAGLRELSKSYLGIATLKVETLGEGSEIRSQTIPLSGTDAFKLYQEYGFPLELTEEEWLRVNSESGFKLSSRQIEQMREEFKEAEQEHKSQSRSGAEQKFAGGLADHSEVVTKLHTAHHLLLRALQQVLGDQVKQRGSNITGERLRIDFNSEKVTPEQLAEIEKIVNEKIGSKLPVVQVMMPREDAEKIGAQMEFGQKYPDQVSVYFIGGEPNEDGVPQGWFSAEFCGGPHVSNTSELAEDGKRFKIQKEESSSAGVRRIKASLV